MAIVQNNFAASNTKNNMMLNSKSIGNKIAVARKKINLSQAELALKVSISPQAVGKWERGESMPDITTLNRLAEILGVDLNYFSESFQSADIEMTTIDALDKQSLELPSSKQRKKLSWDMSLGNWVDADFSGLKNLKEKFSSSNMKNCKFVGSDMSGLLLKNNNIEGCDFSSSDFSSIKIQGSNLLNNLFKDCSLNEAEFARSYIMGSDFSGANFTGVAFSSGGFQKNPITNAMLNRTSFIDTQVVEMVFDGTLEACSFES
jgi:transcriptional regulator with XRE-family HTH domain